MSKLFHDTIILYSLWYSGPLNAVLDAQAQAATTTINFLQTFAMFPNGSMKMIEFTYSATNATSGQLYDTKMYVPLITILPVPFIRVSAVATSLQLHEDSVYVHVVFDGMVMVCVCDCLQVAELTIEFNAKITSVVSETSDKTETDTGSKSTRDWWWWWSTPRSAGTFSTTTKSKSSKEATSEFSLNIVCRAVQDEMPAGLKKMLSILEEAIRHVDT
jgi:Protein of unknown function (DUF2589)